MIKTIIKAFLFIVGIPVILKLGLDASFLPIFLFCIALYAIKLLYGTSKLDKALISLLSLCLVAIIVWFAIGDVVLNKIKHNDPFYEATRVRRNLEAGLESASKKDPVDLESRTLLFNYRQKLDKENAKTVKGLLDEGKTAEAIEKIKETQKIGYEIKAVLDDPTNDWDVKTKKLWRKIFSDSPDSVSSVSEKTKVGWNKFTVTPKKQKLFVAHTGDTVYYYSTTGFWGEGEDGNQYFYNPSYNGKMMKFTITSAKSGGEIVWIKSNADVTPFELKYRIKNG